MNKGRIMDVSGKGFFIWKIKDCEGGNPQAITNAAQQAGLTHVLLKIADGAYAYNINRETGFDFTAPVVQSLKAAGIQVWGWHYVYGDHPTQEADIAVERLRDLGIDKYVIDAEHEYKEPGKDYAADVFIRRIRSKISNIQIALSSYRFPSFHPQLPWKTFLERCDYNMPQVYWEQAHNPIPNLERTVREFGSINPFRPIIPTGPTYRAGAWVPTIEDLNQFMQSAKSLNLSAVNFFSWDECRPTYQHLWQTISDFAWNGEGPQKDISQQLIDALNSKDIKKISALYNPQAVHITSARTIQGKSAIEAWYTTLLNQLLPNGKFKLTGFTGSGNARQLHWTCKTDITEITDGSDTIGLLNNKIAYHYTQFTIVPIRR
ncbi:MAG: hypothetical protein CL609_12415 [Anaerolineaceae bacterium]|nr:hypothetical protein [Anaerolineaceae bacterium]